MVRVACSVIRLLPVTSGGEFRGESSVLANRNCTESQPRNVWEIFDYKGLRIEARISARIEFEITDSSP